MSEQRTRDRRRRIIGQIAGRGGAYAALLLVAAVMLFPFFFMAATAVKTPDDTFRFPPKILPRSPAVAEIDGEEQELFLLEVPGGGSLSAFVAESGVDAGLFVESTATADDAVPWPLSFATPTGDTVTFEGEVLDVFDVDFNGDVRSMAMIRNTSVSRFVGVDDRSAETYAVARTATRDEFIDPQWGNFEEIVELRDFDRSLTNTILVTVLVVGGTLFTSIMGGYAFSRIKFPGRDAIFVAYIGSIMIPFVVLIVPLFRLMVGLGWVNSLGSLVWPFLFNAYGTFLLRQFFVAIPTELEEAAFVDGARRWTILWRIYVPLSWPAIATLATFIFLYAWNSFIWPLVSINLSNSDDFVLTLALQTLNGNAGEGPNLVFAAIVLSVIIPFTVFALAQRYFVENAATSGIK